MYAVGASATALIAIIMDLGVNAGLTSFVAACSGAAGGIWRYWGSANFIKNVLVFPAFLVGLSSFVVMTRHMTLSGPTSLAVIFAAASTAFFQQRASVFNALASGLRRPIWGALPATAISITRLLALAFVFLNQTAIAALAVTAVCTGVAAQLASRLRPRYCAAPSCRRSPQRPAFHIRIMGVHAAPDTLDDLLRLPRKHYRLYRRHFLATARRLQTFQRSPDFLLSSRSSVRLTQAFSCRSWRPEARGETLSLSRSRISRAIRRSVSRRFAHRYYTRMPFL